MRAVAHPLGDHPEDESHFRWVRQSEAGPGLVRLMAQLTNDEAALVERAIEHAMAQTWKASAVSAGTSNATGAGARRADALVGLAERYLAQADDTSAGPPVEVVVHVDATNAVGTLDDGTSLPATTVDRLCCDAHLVHATDDDHGNVVALGRRRRTIPTLLRRAMMLRDHGCRFPGCTNRLVDGHHIQPWSAGGATTLDNLLALCRRHHRYVHEYGFRIERDAGALRFIRRNGIEVNAAGESAFLPDSSISSHFVPAAVTAQTTFPQWDGKPADYHEIVGGIAWRHEQAGWA